MSDEVKTRSEIAKLDAETTLAEARTRTEQDKHVDWLRYRSNDEAEALKNGIYILDTDVNSASVRDAIADLDHLSRRAGPDQAIRLILNSPGGSVFHGMALYDFLQELRLRGHELTTVGLGWSASMAGILLMAGDKRVMGANSWLMIHEPSSMGVGKVSEIQDEAKFLRRVADRSLKILAERSTMTEKQIATKWDRKDWWLDADEALSLGFIDEIAERPPFVKP